MDYTHKKESFCASKDTISRLKGQPTEWEKYLQIMSDKGLKSRVHKELLQWVLYVLWGTWVAHRLSIWLLISAQIMVSGMWNWAQCQALCSAGNLLGGLFISPSSSFPLFLSLSLSFCSPCFSKINKYFLKKDSYKSMSNKQTNK